MESEPIQPAIRMDAAFFRRHMLALLDGRGAEYTIKGADGPLGGAAARVASGCDRLAPAMGGP